MGLALDRACALRRDGAALSRALAAPALHLLPLWQGRVLVDDHPHAVWLTGEAATRLRALAETEVFLGLEGETPWLAVDLSACPGDPEQGPDLDLGGRFMPLRTMASVLPAQQAALLAYAKGMLHWHSRHCHCGVCGAPTRAESGGHVRRCDSCAAEHYPRTDPAIIVLVHDRHELEDARWFTRAEVLADFDGENTFLPTPDSIARWMMDRWLAGEVDL